MLLIADEIFMYTEFYLGTMEKVQNYMYECSNFREIDQCKSIE